jgi:hypothetical protein
MNIVRIRTCGIYAQKLIINCVNVSFFLVLPYALKRLKKSTHEKSLSKFPVEKSARTGSIMAYSYMNSMV